MLRRIGDVVKTIFSLVEAVSQLKAENELLMKEISELRREVDEQAGQVKVLIEFVRSALEDRMERRAEAAARAVLAEYESKSGSNRQARRNEKSAGRVPFPLSRRDANESAT
jgi:hypothetical protein